tara:strand:- start:1047 stop:1163 length:117 start_codon:yes stop_codon:yes gene_type:complete
MTEGIYEINTKQVIQPDKEESDFEYDFTELVNNSKKEW